MFRSLASLICLACVLNPLIAFSAEIGSTEGFEPYLARRNGKWGYLQHAWGIPQKDWKTAIPFEYDWASTFNGLTSATVRKNGKYGLVDRQWRLIVPPEYDYAFPFENGMAVVYRDGKYGAVDETGKLVIPIEHDSLGSFRDMGTAVATKGDKSGVVRKTGDVVISIDHPFAITNGMGICGGYVPKVGWQYTDHLGRPLAREKGTFDNFDYNSDGVTVLFQKDGSVEIIDWATGKNLLPGAYESIKYDQKSRICIVKTASGTGVYDLKQEKWVIPAEYAEVNEQDGVFRAIQRSGKHRTIRYIRKDGSKLFDADFEDAGVYAHGLVPVQLKGKWGVINSAGNVVIPFEFERDDLHRIDGFFAAWISGKGWGVYDKAGRQVLAHNYRNPDGDEPFVFCASGYCEVMDMTSRKHGILNSKFEWMTPSDIYDDFNVASECMDGHIYVPFKRGQVKGLWDLTTRKEVLSGSLDLTVGTDYDHIGYLENERWGIIDFITWKPRYSKKFEYDGFDHRTKTFDVISESPKIMGGSGAPRLHGVVDMEGKFVIPMEYEKLSKQSDERLYIAYKNDRVGFIDFNGKTVVPFKFDPVFQGDSRFIRETSFIEGHVYLRQKGEMVLIDTKGKVVARESQFNLPGTDSLIFCQVGNMGIYAAETESDVIHFLVDGRLYERPGGCINQEKDDLRLKEGRLAVRRDGKWGYLDEDGKEVIACRFEEAGQFNQGTAFVKHEGKYHYINHSGAILQHSDMELRRLRKKK